MRQRSTDTEPGPYVVRSVARALDILDVLQAEVEGAPLGRIADAVDLPKSSVFRYLSTLRDRGYVSQDPTTGDYRLGMGFAPSHPRHLQVLTDRARPMLERLRDRLEETVNLAVLDGTRIAYLEILESTRAMRLAARVGNREPVHSSALGKSICALMTDAEVTQILRAEGMPRLTAKTITTIEDFLAELAGVRRRGWALDDREHEEDGRCVAVAIRGSRIPAAISVSAPSARFSQSDAGPVAEALMAVASELADSSPEPLRGDT